MLQISYYKALRETNITYLLKSAIFLILILRHGACATAIRKQPTLYTDSSAQILASRDRDDDSIECRIRNRPGSKLAVKICATKKEWANLDNKYNKNTNEFDKRIRQRIDLFQPDIEDMGRSPR
jgi:hypothetical protein